MVKLIEKSIAAGSAWVSGNPWLFLLGVLIVCAILVLIGWGLVKYTRSANAAETKALHAYREAAAQLAYLKQPFKLDTDALKAIVAAREFDAKALHEIVEYTPSLAAAMRSGPAAKNEPHGLRQYWKAVFGAYVSNQTQFEQLVIERRTVQAQNRYHELHNVALADQLARQTVCQAHVIKALSSYIDTGKVITEAANAVRARPYARS